MEDCEPHDWLFPETLSRETLVETLKQRYIKHTEVDHLDKVQLVDLYYKYVLPLPQRKYCLNRRGRAMTRKQIAAAKKRKNLQNSDTEPPTKKSHQDTTNQRFITSFSDLSSSGDRIKPPPSCVDFKKKTIKLTSGVKVANSSAKSVTNCIKISSSPQADTGNEDTDIEPERKKIKSNSFLNDSVSDVKKTVKLINRHLTLSDKASKNTTHSEKTDSTVTQKTEQQDESVSETKEKKKNFKAKKISWP